jgi:hypothetical protein
MMVRKGFVGAAAAVLAMGSFAFAADPSTTANATDSALLPDSSFATAANQGSQVTPVEADGSAPVRPITQLLNKVGLGNLPFTVGGWVEGGYMYDTSSPKENVTGAPTQLFYNHYKNRAVLDQADLYLDRTPTTSGTAWDWGFHVEAGYGTDFGFIHSNGIADFNLPPALGGSGPNTQYDFPQLYVAANVPIGSGLGLKAGKFYTTLGYETYPPGGNSFYSHSYLYSFAIPVTQTGVLATYAITPTVTVTAGITRGWDQSTNDSNSAIDFLGNVAWTPDSKTAITLQLSEGPQFPHAVGHLTDGINGDDGSYWTLVDLDATYQWSDQTKLGFNADYGDAPHALTDAGIATGSAQWYGAAAYISYVLNPMFTINGRAEIYDDANGFTVLGNGATNLYLEGTFGVGITPLPNDAIFQWLSLRPELRYDYADHPAYGLGASDRNQFSLAIDAVMQL